MPPKKPRPADTGGVPKPVRTGTLTGETPVKEHIKKIEKNGGKGAPKPTEEKKLKEKVLEMTSNMYVGSKVAACNKGKGAKHSRRSFFDLFVSSFKAKISPNDGYIDKKRRIRCALLIY